MLKLFPASFAGEIHDNPALGFPLGRGGESSGRARGLALEEIERALVSFFLNDAARFASLAGWPSNDLVIGERVSAIAANPNSEPLADIGHAGHAFSVSLALSRISRSAAGVHWSMARVRAMRSNGPL